MSPGPTFTPAERRALAAAAAGGGPVACPVCDVAMARHAVEARPGVAYVRHRVLLICPRCRRSVAVDTARPPRG